MKSIFGFAAGAALGAGGLYGLRKVLKLLEPSEVAVSSAPGVSSARPVSTTAANPAAKVEIEKATEKTPEPTPEISMSNVTEDLEKAQEAVSKLEELVSLVGEPPARHEEPIAAVESVPEAMTPRSETAEEAVPENVEVIPASPAAPTVKKTIKAAASTTEKKPAKVSSKTSKAVSDKPDDFTVIMDIGPVFNKKLQDAGIKSFKELAETTAAQIEEKTGIPAERVEHGKWIEQAQKIAAG